MTRHQMESELRSLIARMTNTDVSRTGLDEPLYDALGIDSLTSLEVMAEVEDHYNVLFSDEQISRPRTLANIIAALDEISWRKAS